MTELLEAPVLPTRRSDDLYDDILLPPDAIAVRAEARAFAQRVIAPRAVEFNTAEESKAIFPADIMKEMAEAGLYEIPFGTDVGGRGLPHAMLCTAIVLEELAYFSPGIASALYDGQAILVGKTLDAAPAHLRQRYLPALVRGEVVGAFATSEPLASTDLRAEAMQTTAVPTEGGYLLSGRKRWITNSCVAEFMLVLCVVAGRQAMLLVDMHQSGVWVGEPDKKMGNRMQLTSDVSFDNVFVPADQVVAEPGRGLQAALGSLALGRTGIGAVGVGMAQAAFDYAADYLGERRAFGKRLGEFQHWQFRFAEHAIGIESARSLYQKAALKMDSGRSPEPEAAMAKVAGSRLPVDVTRDAIQVHGGYGFLRQLSADGRYYPLESIWRDCKIGEIYEGANEVQLWTIARAALGRGLTG